MVRRSIVRRNPLPLFLLLGVLAIAQLTPATAAGNSTEVGVGADASACDGDASTIEDDVCDVENNNEACGYDGGDCCPCDCDDTENWYVSCGDDGFACVDPSSDCVEEGVTADGCGDLTKKGDDVCDVENNNEACGYDGGDCCPCDCDDTGNVVVSCGDDGFACVDPSSDCVEEGVTADGCGDLTKKGDDVCDAENNNEACGYDGGDCCPCDCDDTGNVVVSCGDDGFACVDPSSDCVEEGVTADGCGDLTKTGDDVCDVENNNEACGYDGGDCCPCDCDDTENWSVSCGDDGFACVDPSSDCVEEGVTADGCGDLTKKGDDVCDAENNNEACGYDGGDCCPCDCDDTGNVVVSCGDDGFACVDPSSDCVEEGVTADGCGDLTKKGDDVCDAENNNDACGYDGGDCCPCDCDDTENWSVSCGDGGFACIDPSSDCVEEGVTADGCDDLTKKGDDVCDAENNIATCGYDGGDCCECDCDDTGNVLVSCGDNGFDCIDPSSECGSDFSGATYSLARSSFAASVCVFATVAGLLLRPSLEKLL